MADRHRREHAVRRGGGRDEEFYSAAFELPVHCENAVPDGIAVDLAAEGKGKKKGR